MGRAGLRWAGVGRAAWNAPLWYGLFPNGLFPNGPVRNGPVPNGPVPNGRRGAWGLGRAARGQSGLVRNAPPC